jgi:hypothetical protein
VSAYTLVLWVGVAICGAAAVLSWVLPTRGDAPTPREEELAEENAELGPAGFTGLASE